MDRKAPSCVHTGMKAGWFLLAMVGAASASPPPPRPPIERNCNGPLAWDKMQACIERFEKGATVRKLSPEVRIVVVRDSRQYLLAHVAAGWQLASQLDDENYELVQRSAVMLGTQPAVRIDLSHHVPIDNDRVFRERVTHICVAGEIRCLRMVTACTVIKHGRAVETFRGELKIEEGWASVVGDRTHSGQYCSGR